MTKQQAYQIAKKIWPGKRPSIFPAVASIHTAGTVQWWVDVGNQSHALDVDGKPICHEECITRAESA